MYFTRERHRRDRAYFGPYSSAKRVRGTLDLLGKVFLFRSCEGAEPGRRSGSPCLDYYIKRCGAPCVGYVSKEEYREGIDGVMAFLSGRFKQIERDLERRIKKLGGDASTLASISSKAIAAAKGPLHMLRGIIGTETFWSGIREYYRRYRDRNASTADFRQVMEEAANSPLSWFFDQWLNRPGIPMLSGYWRFDAGAREIEVEISQTQNEDVYRLPLEIGIGTSDGGQRIERLDLASRTGRFRLTSDAPPANVESERRLNAQ